MWEGGLENTTTQIYLTKVTNARGDENENKIQ